MVVLNVCEIDPPTGVSAPLKPISCAPSTGATPYAGPFRHEIRPVLPTVQPVSSVEPAGKSTLAPGASAGDSKLPLVTTAGELATTETLSNSKSTATVADEVSLNVKVELLLVAVNVNVCAEP